MVDEGAVRVLVGLVGQLNVGSIRWKEVEMRYS